MEKRSGRINIEQTTGSSCDLTLYKRYQHFPAEKCLDRNRRRLKQSSVVLIYHRFNYCSIVHKYFLSIFPYCISIPKKNQALKQKENRQECQTDPTVSSKCNNSSFLIRTGVKNVLPNICTIKSIYIHFNFKAILSKQLGKPGRQIYICSRAGVVFNKDRIHPQFLSR